MRINGYGLSSSEVPLSQTGRKEQQSEISVAPVKKHSSSSADTSQYAGRYILEAGCWLGPVRENLMFVLEKCQILSTASTCRIDSP